MVRTLLIEDNPSDAELATLRLSENRRVAFEVTQVASLNEALEWLAEHDCDVVLLDLNLPDSNGLRSLTSLREFRPTLAVVVVSGAVDESTRLRAVALEAEDVISKDHLDSCLFSSSVLSVVERNRADDQRRQFEKILEATPDAVVVADLHGVLKYVNGQALNFFERTREELAKERLMFSASEGATVELRVRGPGGEKIGEMRVAEFEWDSEPCVLASIRDITQQHNLELQLMTSDRLVSLGTLAASVAHEINNPLAALLANLSVASQEVAEWSEKVAQTSELPDALTDAREAGDRIRQIVRDLKVFSRAEEDTRSSYDLHRILDSVCRMAWTEVRHSARIVKDYGTVPLIYVNESRVSQVFLNLLVNAGQAIEPGSADQNEVRIETDMAPDGRIRIRFKDTGPGIPQSVQERMFTPFFTTKPAGLGTGLGLAICQRIVRSLGGEIDFVSKVGEGTCFTVLLPAEPAPSKRRKIAAPRAEKASSRRRVLVIDDETIILQAVGRVLKAEHDVQCCLRAVEALEMLKTGAEFDLFLCDVMMPEMTGMAFASELEKELPELLERVVFMTGGALTAGAREFLDRVPNLRLEKPFDAQGLRALVSNVPIRRS